LVAAAGVLAVLLTGEWVRSQSAPQADPEWQKQLEAQKQRQVDAAVRKAKGGKSAIIGIDTLKLGDRELVRVTLEDTVGHRVCLVPCFQTKEKAWVTPADLVRALRDVPRGNYEVIHTDERYGVEWVVGVGEGSPDTLENFEKQMAFRKWTPATPEKTEGAADAKEPVKAKSTGVFVELGQGTIEGVEARIVVIERGVAMQRAEFWMVDVDRNGKFVKPARNVLKVAESLKKGDQVEIEYTQIGDFLLIDGVRVLGEK
jgi:hypothetical protein